MSRRFTAEDLLEAIGEIGDEKIKAAEHAANAAEKRAALQRKRFRTLRRWSALAVSACVVLAVGWRAWSLKEEDWTGTGNGADSAGVIAITDAEEHMADTAIEEAAADASEGADNVNRAETAQDPAGNETAGQQAGKTASEREVKEEAEKPAENEAATEESDSVEDLVLESAGVDVPIYVAYRGDLYGADDYEITPDTMLAPDDAIFFAEDYGYDAYVVREQPELVVIAVNGGFQVYRRLYAFDLKIDGVTYGLRHPADRSGRGAVVKTTEDFIVYEAAESAYLIDLSPYLIREYPDTFTEDEEWIEYWWIATPIQ